MKIQNKNRKHFVKTKHTLVTLPKLVEAASGVSLQKSKHKNERANFPCWLILSFNSFAMHTSDDVRNLPIDITFSRLGGHNSLFLFFFFPHNFVVIFFFLFWFSEFEFATFAEWLIDRKRVPADWRKRVAAIRARISKEFSSLPKDSDPFFQTLDPEGSNFMSI